MLFVVAQLLFGYIQSFPVFAVYKGHWMHGVLAGGALLVYVLARRTTGGLISFAENRGDLIYFTSKALYFCYLQSIFGMSLAVLVVFVCVIVLAAR